MSLLIELIEKVLKETVFEGTLRSPAVRYVVGTLVALLGFILILSAFLQTPLTPDEPDSRRAMLWVGAAILAVGTALILWARHSQKA